MNSFQVKCQLVNRYFIVFVGVSKFINTIIPLMSFVLQARKAKNKFLFDKILKRK